MNSKDFKKKYSSSTKNISGKGVWSGRGTGIPVAGAVGGGDDYPQKIGRNKRPYFQGDSGSPNQSADAGFSSHLSRVNKGYEDFDTYDIMFPDQDEEFENSYVSSIVSKKVPNKFATHSGKGFDLPGKENINELLGGSLKRLAADIFGDAIAGGLSTLTGGLSSWPLVYKNVIEIRSDMEESTVAIQKYVNAPMGTPDQDSAVAEIERVYESLMVNFIDLVQRTVEAIPDPSPTGESVSFISSIILNAQKLAKLLRGSRVAKASGFAQKGLWSKTKMAFFIHPLAKWISAMFDNGDIEDALKTEQIIASGRTSASDTRVQISQRIAPKIETVVVSKNSILSAPRRLVQLSDILEAYDEQKEYLSTTGGMMPENKLKIKETVYDNDMAYHPPNPKGYEYRNVSDVLDDLDAKNDLEDFKTIEDFKNFVVAYKDSGGITAYQAREDEKILREQALRRLVRKGLKSILEDKKKETEDDEDEVNEFSGVAGIAGMNIPLGDVAPNFTGRKRKSPAEAAGSGFGNAKPAKRNSLKQIKRKK